MQKWRTTESRSELVQAWDRTERRAKRRQAAKEIFGALLLIVFLFLGAIRDIDCETTGDDPETAVEALPRKPLRLPRSSPDRPLDHSCGGVQGESASHLLPDSPAAFARSAAPRRHVVMATEAQP